MTRKISIRIATVIALLLVTIGASAQSVITYQGQLENSQGAVTDTVTMNFSLWDAANLGSQIASVSPQSVEVVDGLFQVELDFGANAFDSDPRYLEVIVDGSTMSDRQRVTAVPVALRALNSEDGFWQESSSGNIGYDGGNVTVGSGLLSRFGINADAGELIFLARGNGQTAVRVNENHSVSIGANHSAAGVPDRGLRVDGQSVFAEHVSMQGDLGVNGSLGVQGGASISGETNIGSLAAPQRLGVGTDNPWNTLHVVSGPGDSPLRIMVEDNTTSSAVLRGYINQGVAIGNSYADSEVPSRGLIVRGEIHARDLPWRGTDPISNLCPEPIDGGPVWRLVRCMADSSSIRFKKNIETLEGSADIVRALRPVRYLWKDSGNEDIGLIAEEVNEVIPEIILRDDKGEIQGFRYNRLGALLIGAFQELERTNEERLARLQAENEELKQRLESAEASLVDVRTATRRNLELERRLTSLEALLQGQQKGLAESQM